MGAKKGLTVFGLSSSSVEQLGASDLVPNEAEPYFAVQSSAVAGRDRRTHGDEMTEAIRLYSQRVRKPACHHSP